MKKITFLLLFVLTNIGVAQEKMTSYNGIINFEASVPFFEEIKAKNDRATSIFNPRTNELSCTAIIKEFRFKMALMERHFNENYIESNRYPKATFRGIIEKFDLKDINEIPKEYQIKGKLEIHGKSKNIIIKARFKKENEGIELISNFALNTDDYKIEIPYIIRNKISKTVNTQIECVLR